MNISSQLHFEKAGANAPDLHCHFCNTPHSKEGWQIADLQPFLDESSAVSIVICSDACKEKLLTWDIAEKALANMIMHVTVETGEVLKPEWEAYFYDIIKDRFVHKL